jgi:uncharacterized protein (TIGR03067 family)
LRLAPFGGLIMIVRILPVLLALSVVPIGAHAWQERAAREGDARSDLQELQGTWQLTSFENGTKVKQEVKDRTLFVGANLYVSRDGAKVSQIGTLRLATGRTPRSIDVVVRKGEHEDSTMLGIYELKDDTLKVCFDAQGDSRPKTFDAPADSKRFVAVYKRVRPAGEGVDIRGRYRSDSLGLDGKKVTTHAEIQKHGDAYLVRWTVSEGVAYVGTGIRQGNTFSVAWANRGGAGISVYKIEKGGILRGVFTELGGVGVIGQETLTPSRKGGWVEVRLDPKPAPAEGIHRVAQRK